MPVDMKRDTPPSRITTPRDLITLPRVQPRAPVLRGVLLGVCVLVLLLPRLASPADFWTTDEARHWSGRAERFLDALRTGDLAATNQTGHPGVTTMWLGAAGAGIYRILAAQGRVEPASTATHYVEMGDYGRAAAAYAAHAKDYARYRYLLRLPLALATALILLLCGWLLWRMLPAGAAGLAILFLAADPFLTAHSKILHLDALLSVLVLLSILAAVAGWHPHPTPPNYRMLLLSGVAGGLALLTKSPALLLPPLIALIALLHWLPHRQQLGRHVVLPLLGWGGIALATMGLLWPALWVDAPNAIQTVINEVIGNGGRAHPDGNFFLGQVVGDPGWLYYPVVLALRLTPWAMLGILAGAAVLPRHRTDTGRLITVLAIAALLFLVLLSMPPKKFDRYILPVFPLLNILASVSIWQVWQHAIYPWLAQHAPTCQRSIAAGLVGLLLIAMLGTQIWYHPYQIAYYNPLVGGSSTAVRSIVVGWGEGLEQAGAVIRGYPQGCTRPLASWYEETILPDVCSAVMNLGWTFRPDVVAYSVLYINQIQRGVYSDVIAHLQAQGPPLHVVTLYGIPYASVYQVVAHGQYPVSATFGAGMHLTSYDLRVDATDQVIRFAPRWRATTPPPDLLMFVHLLDDKGQRIAQIDVPPAGAALGTAAWVAGYTATWEHPLPLPADLPPGRYWLAVGLYDPTSGQRLPITAPPATPADAPAYDADALLLPLEWP